MIVVDTNITVYLWMPGEYTTVSESILHKEKEWVVPFLWQSEFCNVLSVYVRNNQMSKETALKILALAEMFFKNRIFPVASEDVLKLSIKSKCSACDCAFVSLADNLNVPLLTMDRRIVKAFPKRAKLAKTFV